MILPSARLARRSSGRASTWRATARTQGDDGPRRRRTSSLSAGAAKSNGIHRVVEATIIPNLQTCWDDIPADHDSTRPHALYRLGPPLPGTPTPSGRQYRAGHRWVPLDQLLISPTLAEAIDRTKTSQRPELCGPHSTRVLVRRRRLLRGAVRQLIFSEYMGTSGCSVAAPEQSTRRISCSAVGLDLFAEDAKSFGCLGTYLIPSRQPVRDGVANAQSSQRFDGL